MIKNIQFISILVFFIFSESIFAHGSEIFYILFIALPLITPIIPSVAGSYILSKYAKGKSIFWQIYFLIIVFQIIFLVMLIALSGIVTKQSSSNIIIGVYFSFLYFVLPVLVIYIYYRVIRKDNN